MPGLKRGTVLLAPHEKEWETFAAETMDRLLAALGDTTAEMQAWAPPPFRRFRPSPSSI